MLSRSENASLSDDLQEISVWYEGQVPGGSSVDSYLDLHSIVIKPSLMLPIDALGIAGQGVLKADICERNS